ERGLPRKGVLVVRTERCVAQQACFVGETNRDEGATGALGGVDEWRWNWSGGRASGGGDLRFDPLLEFRSDGERNALLRRTVIDHAFRAAVSVVAEDEALQTEL